MKKQNNKIDIKENPCSSHAKCIIVSKKIARISSFNFLSFGKIKKRELFSSGELGIVINSKEIGRKIN
ncbi:MAG: hypothetical protein ACTSPD_21135 [Promethearchaeota archaeon]